MTTSDAGTPTEAQAEGPPRSVRKHKVFSPARTWAISSNTLLELVRMKVFYFMILFGLIGIGMSIFASTFKFQEQFQVLKDVSLGAMSVFTWLLATLATASLLPKEIEDRTLYTILAKPVPRFEYLIGKLIGVLLMLLIALLLMSVVFVGVLYATEQIAIADRRAMFGPGPDLDAALAEVRAAAFNVNLIPGIIVIYVKAALCAALTLLISTFASTTIFTIIISVIAYIIGHIQPIAREYWLTYGTGGVDPSPLLKAFVGFVALMFPDFQLFNLVDDIAVGNVVAPLMFMKTVGLGCGYIFIYTLVGYVLFANKEL